MRGTGNLPPTLFLIGHDGKQVMFIPENLADIEAEDDFVTMSKLMAVVMGATIAVITSRDNTRKLDEEGQVW
jgi:hypothetical protein